MEHIYIDMGSDQTVVALHGTGGNAQEMADLVSKYLPGRNVLAVQGDVMVNGMRRYAGVDKSTGFIDEEDMVNRLDALNATIQSYIKDINPAHLTLLGYSNGANAISALVLSGKSLAQNHILLRPMDYHRSFDSSDLSDKVIHVFAGRHDHLVPLVNVESLIHKFEEEKAKVEYHLLNSTHQLTMMELQSLDKL